MKIPPAEADPRNQLTDLLWRNLRRARPELCFFANKAFIKQKRVAGDARRLRQTGEGRSARRR